MSKKEKAVKWIPLTNIAQCREGARVRCKKGDEVVHKTNIDDARLSHDDSGWFVCQNVAKGNSCANTYGYQYSWQISNEDGSHSFLDFTTLVHSFEILLGSDNDSDKPSRSDATKPTYIATWDGTEYRDGHIGNRTLEQHAERIAEVRAELDKLHKQSRRYRAIEKRLK